VAVHNYRSQDGQVFYASRYQPDVPAAVRADVTEVGRVLSYNPIHRPNRPGAAGDKSLSGKIAAMLNASRYCAPAQAICSPVSPSKEAASGGYRPGNPVCSRRSGRAWPLLVVAAAAVLLLASCGRDPQQPDRATPLSGPLAAFLGASTDLGRPTASRPKLPAALPSAARPQALFDWAEGHHLSVRWRVGDNWAYVAGAAQDLGSAFGVSVHSYRRSRRSGFYASQEQPAVPHAGAVRRFGARPHSQHNPIHVLRPPIPLDVPKGALTPTQLATTYNSTPVKTTGKGQTIVFFELDTFDQSDFDKFTKKYDLPPLKPTVIGDEPDLDVGETAMDLEVAHG